MSSLDIANAIGDAISDEVEKAVNDAVDAIDFDDKANDAISEAAGNHDFSDAAEEAVREALDETDLLAAVRDALERELDERTAPFLALPDELEQLRAELRVQREFTSALLEKLVVMDTALLGVQRTQEVLRDDLVQSRRRRRWRDVLLGR